METVNSNNMKKPEDDGWDHGEFDDTTSLEEVSMERHTRKNNGALQVLKAQHHSLEPDMVNGWKPKLPSCPLPLSYTNVYVDSLLEHIVTDDRYKLAFLGPRYLNSVHINQQYNYTWRYRTKYSLNVAIIREAVSNVGSYNARNTEVEKCEYGFDSSFESGNLDMAIRVKRNQYDLFLRSDTNTRGHTNWYYFKVSNGNEIGQVQLNICNFGKNKSLYNKGMKPYVMVEGKDGWSQEHAYDVAFVQRLCRYGFDKKTYQLQYKFMFKQKNMSVCFAYAIPYTYSKLEAFIGEVVQEHPSLVKTGKLCETLGGVNVPLLTITNSGEGEQNINDNVELGNTKKKAVLITGRIHPGQSNASFVVEGFVRKLLSNSEESIAMRNAFVFYVIPMLNPDGVIAGNFRTSFSGKDLNRQFNKLNKFVFPEVTHLHDFTLNLKRSYRSGFQFYFDFHGHSSKKGLFCYGPEHPTTKLEFFKSRAFAKLIEQNNPIFSYKKSIFTISQHKKTTGRAHMLWKIKIPMSFTFEVSNGLYETKQNKCCPLNQDVVMGLGESVFKGFYKYALLEMRIPTGLIKAKVDSGIRAKRKSINSSKTFSKVSSLKKRGQTKTLKEIGTDENKRPFSRQKLAGSQIEDAITKAQEKEFMKIVKQIKREHQEIKEVDEYEGGSDSEDDEEDLSAEELKKLYKIIENKNSNPNKTYGKMSTNWRIRSGKIEAKRNESYEDVIEYQTKKVVTSKYLDMRKNQMPPRCVKRPMLLETEKVVLAQKNYALQI